jgi:hypothetical protein
MIPTGDGAYEDADITTVPYGVANKYTSVDDPVGSPDDLSTYIVTFANKAETDLITFTFADILVAGDITALTVYVRANRLNLSSSPELKVILLIGGALYYSAALAITDSLSNLSATFANNPATGTAWTVAAINAAEIGVSMQKLNDKNNIGVTQLYAIVTYTPTSDSTSGASLLL